jgi:DNA polymerase elongation subunit (family B)
MPAPKILTLDIETSPNMGYFWGLFKQTISLKQLLETTQVISFAAKWHDSDEVIFYSDFHHGHMTMLRAIHKLLSKADIVVHFNGRAFDLPHLNREFLLTGLGAPAPYQDVDLYLIAKKTFRFASNKLDHISEQLGLGNKVEHEGFGLWVKCLEGDPDAWERMKVYNMHDVVLTEQVYDDFLPWIFAHPHWGLYTDETHVCARCGSNKLQRRGYARTSVGKYPRFQCKNCGGWSKGKNRVFGVDERGI